MSSAIRVALISSALATVVVTGLVLFNMVVQLNRLHYLGAVLQHQKVTGRDLGEVTAIFGTPDHSMVFGGIGISRRLLYRLPTPDALCKWLVIDFDTDLYDSAWISVTEDDPNAWPQSAAFWKTMIPYVPQRTIISTWRPKVEPKKTSSNSVLDEYNRMSRQIDKATQEYHAEVKRVFERYGVYERKYVRVSRDQLPSPVKKFYCSTEPDKIAGLFSEGQEPWQSGCIANGKPKRKLVFVGKSDGLCVVCYVACHGFGITEHTDIFELNRGRVVKHQTVDYAFPSFVGHYSPL